MRAMSLRSHPDQIDFFRAPVFTPRRKVERLDAELFRLRIKQAMSKALTQSPLPREAVAAEMARMIGQPGLSRTALDTLTSPSKTGHDISLVRFKALARVTGDASLWDAAVSDDGLFLLQGDEPRLAEIARLQQAQREISCQIRQLTALPVIIKDRG